MNEWKEYTAKTVEEAITEALLDNNTTSEFLEYEVLEKEAGGVLGIFKKSAKIRARLKITVESSAKLFLDKVFKAMNIEASVEIVCNEQEETVEINIIGSDMGVLIGKRGQTLDSLQYLTGLVVNKYSDKYLKVKLDTENYRERRRETLENLAKNIASRVKKTHKPVVLEPMNPYERRIIHSALQNEKYIETHSEGDEPYRKVVVSLKKGVKPYNSAPNGKYRGNSDYSKKYGANSNNKGKKDFNKTYGGNSKDYSSDYKKDYAAYLEEKAAAKAAQANQ